MASRNTPQVATSGNGNLPALPSAAETATDITYNSSIRQEEKKKLPYFSEPDDMVYFLVGDTKKRFTVHKERACYHSNVLDRAFNGPFEEGKTSTYIFEDTAPETFRLFSQYLYTGKITPKLHDENSEDEISGIDENHLQLCSNQDLTLAELWVLGDRFMIPRLQNQIIHHMERARISCGKMSMKAESYIYNNTIDKSPLRKYSVHQVAWYSHSASAFEDNKDLLSAELLLDMVVHYFSAAPDYVREEKTTEGLIPSYFVPEE